MDDRESCKEGQRLEKWFPYYGEEEGEGGRKEEEEEEEESDKGKPLVGNSTSKSSRHYISERRANFKHTHTRKHAHENITAI